MKDGLYADVGGLRLHYAEAGEGPLLLLLHGFPEYWRTWKNQMPALAAAGFRVVAPDLRGYNLSDKPKGVGAYSGARLADDIAFLIRALGRDHAHVVGHDWGGGVAWLFAMRHPGLLDKLAILNSPHPMGLLRAFKTWRQLRKSWYMFAFQLPWLPEAMIRRDGYAAVKAALLRSVGREEMGGFVEAISRPGALTAAVNYYRAMPRQIPRFRRVDNQVLVVWGENDAFLGPELALPDPKWVPNCRLERIPGASHWVHWDAPEKVNALLADFLR